ncbi:MAG: undecaprenyl/decaprenyl-phosphate alpha-N-acetylglucosaminyl 1-phosphate transferase [Spirochaetes bacterium]|nr:undecaprenyl/decaprenyl-phosphate alpha-N-acetylglucosaminyl 1-phosphate transferase [Spirochaetota bacterium]
MNLTAIAILFAAALVLSIILYLPSKGLAFVFGIIDHPGERKIHKKPVPYLGSLMIFGGFALGLYLYGVYFNGAAHFKHTTRLGIVISLSAMFLLGVADDKFDIPALFKFFLQIAVASIPVFFGIGIDRVTNPLGGVIMLHPVVSHIVTVFWLVALANAMNLIDGMDGLCSGVSAISIFFIMIVSYLTGSNVIYPMAALLGGILGYLIFNFPPARIFMGDSGALFIGYAIGIFSLVSNIKTSFAITLMLPVVLLLVPILDTLLAIIRRMKNGQRIFGADKNHLHHRLLLLTGNRPRRVLAIIYTTCALLGIFSLVTYALPREFTPLLLFILFENIAFAVFLLNLYEKRHETYDRFKQYVKNTVFGAAPDTPTEEPHGKKKKRK